MTEPLPERITLRSSPLEAMLLLVAASAITFLVVSRIPPEEQGARLTAIGICVLLAVLAIATSLRRLTLDATGFSEGNLFGRTRRAWRDCSPFEVSAGGGRVQVNAIRATSPAGETRIRTRYGRSLTQIADLMNRFRARATGSDT